MITFTSYDLHIALLQHPRLGSSVHSESTWISFWVEDYGYINRCIQAGLIFQADNIAAPLKYRWRTTQWQSSADSLEELIEAMEAHYYARGLPL